MSRRGEAQRRLSCKRDALDLAFGCDASAGALFGAIDAHPSGQGQVVMWDVETGGQLFSSGASRGHVSCLYCASGGQTLLLGARDGSVRQISSRDGREVWSFRTGMSDVNLVSLSCNEHYVQVQARPGSPQTSTQASAQERPHASPH